MITELDRTFDMTFNRQVFAAVQLTLDDDRLPYVHDVLLHELPRLGGTRWGGPAGVGAGDCGAAVGCPLAGRTASSRFHMYSSACPLPRALGCLPSYLSGATSGHYSCSEKCCLVLLNPRVSGSARMKGSRCVSILTTTRRPRSRPM